MKNNRLSDRELDLMHILWASDEPMTASEICKSNSELNINTVQTTIRSLTKKKYIDVAEIVYSGTVLCRSYKPLKKADTYFSEEMHRIFSMGKSHSLSGIMAALIDSEKNQEKTIDELEKLLEDRKSHLKRGE